MKKAYKLLAFIILPLQAIAQPVLTSPELYNIAGTMVKRVTCDPVASGPSGANQVWDFSGLSETGDTLVQHVGGSVPGNPFPLANVSLFSPDDTTYTHLQQTTTETLNWGMVDSSSNQASIVYTDPMLLVKRPLTYADTATDSFAYTANFGVGVEAIGSLFYEADGYGTLYLPSDTFTNTVRIRVELHEEDSLDGLGMLYFDNVFYIWYSNDHSSPLLRIDSLSVSGLAQQEFVDVQYLGMEGVVTGVKEVKSQKKVDCSVYLDDKGLLLNGGLESGKQYEVAVFGVNGQQVFKSGFAASGKQQHLAIDSTLSPGMYIVTIRRKGDISSFNAIKVVKQ